MTSSSSARVGFLDSLLGVVEQDPGLYRFDHVEWQLISVLLVVEVDLAVKGDLVGRVRGQEWIWSFDCGQVVVHVAHDAILSRAMPGTTAGTRVLQALPVRLVDAGPL